MGNKYKKKPINLIKSINFSNMSFNDKKQIEEIIAKEIPMKPIEEDGLLLCGECKNHTVAREGYSGEEWCCYACGKVIDWSD